MFAVYIAAEYVLAAEKESESSVINIVALGDSLTEGYQLTKSQAYPALLEEMLQDKGLSVIVHNQGVSGDTTAGGRARLDFAIAQEPDLVIVELGPNDFLRGLPPMSTRQNLEYIVDTLTARDIDVLLVAFNAAANIGPAYAQAFNSIFPDLAEQYPVTLTYDFLKGVAGQPELNLADGIHPNQQGHQIIAENLLPVLLEMLGGAPKN